MTPKTITTGPDPRVLWEILCAIRDWKATRSPSGGARAVKP